MRYAPALRPSRKTAGVLVCEGDSITFGFGLGAGQSWPEQAAALIGGTFDVYNVAKSGRTVQEAGDVHTNMVEHGAIAVDPLFVTTAHFGAPSGIRNVACILGGVNDKSAGATWEEIVAGLETWSAARRVAGWTVVIATPVGTNALQSVDGYLHDHPELYDALADCHAVPQLRDLLNLTYYQDGVHPTAAGALLIAQTFSDAINSLSGLAP